MLVCILTVAAAVGSPATGLAAPGPSAVEEYVLTLPGVDTTDIGEPQPFAKLSQRTSPVGVVGERNEPATALGAITGSASSLAGIIVLGALATATALALRRRRQPRP